MTEEKKPYIQDKVLFSAVSFAKKLIDLGEPVKKWLSVPARYYKISEDLLKQEMIRQGYGDKMEEKPVEELHGLDEIFG